jgi:8-oxo-dGTP diphosphatase
MRLIAALWRALPNRVNWWVLGLWHPRFLVSVVGIVTDAEGRVLLLRHRFWNGRAWGLPGGHLHRHETLEAALSREVREETGLTITMPRQLGARRVTPAALEVVLRATVAGGTLHMQSHEILDARFCDMDEAARLLTPPIAALVRHVLSTDGQG